MKDIKTSEKIKDNEKESTKTEKRRIKIKENQRGKARQIKEYEKNLKIRKMIMKKKSIPV